nr:nucleotidyl transferase AbiEii/AbiGii toxin family protein [Prosthecochloris sp. HL-130-GSB]
MRLKVEINSREHFTVLGYQQIPFAMTSRWHTGQVSITSYGRDELLGTKLRALYQRKKGRDLFDLCHASRTIAVNPESIVSCFLQYMEHEQHKVSRAEFEMNLFEKLDDSRFLEDMGPLLTMTTSWNPKAAGIYVLEVLSPLMPGGAWKQTEAKLKDLKES